MKNTIISSISSDL